MSPSTLRVIGTVGTLSMDQSTSAWTGLSIDELERFKSDKICFDTSKDIRVSFLAGKEEKIDICIWCTD